MNTTTSASEIAQELMKSEKTFVFGFLALLVVVFFTFMLVTNKKMVDSGEHAARTKAASQVKELWSLKKRRTTTIKKAAE